MTLVPDADGHPTAGLLAALAGRTAIVGPSRPWMSVRVPTCGRCVHVAWRRRGDTDEHLVELVLGADEEAAEDLRRRALAPWPISAKAPPNDSRETLRSWLLNQGRRDAVAAELFVHPQTVRYRMNQVRQLYGGTAQRPRRGSGIDWWRWGFRAPGKLSPWLSVRPMQVPICPAYR